MFCLAIGRLLRGAKYSAARIVEQNGERWVHKRRLFFAPLLLWIGGPLLRILGTGVRVLRQDEWEERERRLYVTLYGLSIRVASDGSMLLPCLPGKTLAALLDDAGLTEPLRDRAIAHAVSALAELHRRGYTHADAMAENVLVDLDAGVARWFDFETVHDPGCPPVWQRADDVRALLMTCLVRTAPGRVRKTTQLILDFYEDREVIRQLAAGFASILERPLAFHLAQGGLSFGCFREIGRALNPRVRDLSSKSHMPLTR